VKYLKRFNEGIISDKSRFDEAFDVIRDFAEDFDLEFSGKIEDSNISGDEKICILIRRDVLDLQGHDSYKSRLAKYKTSREFYNHPEVDIYEHLIINIYTKRAYDSTFLSSLNETLNRLKSFDLHGHYWRAGKDNIRVHMATEDLNPFIISKENGEFAF